MKLRLVTPSFNQAAYIERCVRSVMLQDDSCVDLDYIVVDAVSDDGSQEILHRLAAEFPRMKLVIEPDRGQAAALLKGFANSDADVLGWLNADDILLPDCVATVAAVFAGSGADVAYGRAWFIDEEDRTTGAYPTAEFDAEYLRKFCFLSQPSTFFRRCTFERVGGIDPSLHYCMDYCLWIRFAKAQACFTRVHRYLSATRLHGSTKTGTGGLDFVDEVIAMLEREVGAVPQEWRLYRAYRMRGAAAPGRPLVLNFLAALIEAGREYGEWGKIVSWAALVFRDHARAKAAFFLYRTISRGSADRAAKPD